mmetsp:Transcript_63790/g.77997  ORF Transcript_63790/g.77997 Transcript_63790/m.77997 type:complete len:102 (+) Transcript_63790:3-308(+)
MKEMKDAWDTERQEMKDALNGERRERAKADALRQELETLKEVRIAQEQEINNLRMWNRELRMNQQDYRLRLTTARHREAQLKSEKNHLLLSLFSVGVVPAD